MCVVPPKVYKTNHTITSYLEFGLLCSLELSLWPLGGRLWVAEKVEVKYNTNTLGTLKCVQIREVSSFQGDYYYNDVRT